VLFCSPIFIFAFAPLAIVGYWLTPLRWRLAWLAAMSYLFYGWWDWRFCFAMLLTTCVDYVAGRMIAGATTPGARRGWLAVSLCVDLGLLGFFKYAAFTAGSLNAALEAFGLTGSLPVLSVVLPVGISFYTFQSLSYTLDIYYGKVKPAKSLLHYMAFVSLFPQLVAGPIVRYSQLGKQLLALPQRLDRRRLNLGLTFFAAGLVKKVLIADQLAYYSDPLWLHWRTLAPAEALAATLGFTLQLYFDFSGYSLMAIGLGYLLGLELPQNFNSPYRSTDAADFWRRWHMTLSFWLRDYVFLRSGGMHRTRRWFALVWTMFLCGLWHGAAWSFVIWGLYHGVLLLVHHGLRALGIRWKGGWWGRIGTLTLVIAGWVVFRAESLPAAMAMLGRILSVAHWAEPAVLSRTFIVLLIGALLWSILAPNLCELIHVRKAQPRRWALAALAFLAAAAMMLSSQSSPFLYYQF